MPAEVTRYGALAIQVCVPKDWDNDQTIAFAEKQVPCGTTGGWAICKKDLPSLAGDPARVQCASHADNVHLVLAA